MIIKSVQNCPNYFITDTGDVYSRRILLNGNQLWRKMKPCIQSSGYFQVNFWNNESRKYACKLVHRLVGEAFIPNPQNKPQINHKDGNPLNNNIDNLQWVTAAENNIDKQIRNKSIIQQRKKNRQTQRQAKRHKHKIICLQTHDVYENQVQLSKVLRSKSPGYIISSNRKD